MQTFCSQMNMKNFSLENYKKIETGLDLPNDKYFDGLYEEILPRCVSIEPKIIPFFKKSKFWLTSVAAMMLVATSIVLLQMHTENELLTKQIIEDFAYFDKNDFTDDLADQLTEHDILTLEKSMIVHDNETIKQINEFL